MCDRTANSSSNFYTSWFLNFQNVQISILFRYTCPLLPKSNLILYKSLSISFIRCQWYQTVALKLVEINWVPDWLKWFKECKCLYGFIRFLIRFHSVPTFTISGIRLLQKCISGLALYNQKKRNWIL